MDMMRLMQTEFKLTVRKVEFVAIKGLETQSRDAEEKVNPLLVENVVLRVRREELERKLAENRILGVKPQIKSWLKRCLISVHTLQNSTTRSGMEPNGTN